MSLFSDEELQQDQILKYFGFAHLPPPLRDKSRFVAEIAREVVTNAPRNAERTVALRKLLEFKDAYERSFVE